MCTTFGKGDPDANKGDPDAKKGRKLTEQSVLEPKRTVNRTTSVGDEVVDNIYNAYPRAKSLDLPQSRRSASALWSAKRRTDSR